MVLSRRGSDIVDLISWTLAPRLFTLTKTNLPSLGFDILVFGFDFSFPRLWIFKIRTVLPVHAACRASLTRTFIGDAFALPPSARIARTFTTSSRDLDILCSSRCLWF